MKPSSDVFFRPVGRLVARGHTDLHLHAILEPSWDIFGYLGAILERSWPILAQLAHFGAILEQFWRFLGPFCVSWGLLGSVLAYFGAILGHLVTILGYLGPSWGYLGAVLGYLEPSWAILGASWDQERFRNPRPKITVPRFTDLD